MKSILAAILILAIATVATATVATAGGNPSVLVTQAIFSITSSAKTSTANLRIVSMTPKTIGVDNNSDLFQQFMWQAGQAQNLFLTGNATHGHVQEVDLSRTLCAWIQVDQATNIAVNGESPYMVLPSGYNNVVCFR